MLAGWSKQTGSQDLSGRGQEIMKEDRDELGPVLAPLGPH